jgi:hypothetical protein
MHARVDHRTHRLHQIRHASKHKKHKGSWKERDRLVYVVTTLNAPVCADGNQLSSDLHDGGARLYDVSRSTVDRQLYFIQVRASDKTLLGVYTYRFGWQLPQGVQSYKCVVAASSNIDGQYKAHDWKQEAEFDSTFPQS